MVQETKFEGNTFAQLGLGIFATAIKGFRLLSFPKSDILI